MANKKIIVLEGQTIYDLALQYLGELSGAYWLAERNQLPLDADLVAGQELVYKETDVIRLDLVNYFVSSGITIASGDTVAEPSPSIPVVWVREPYTISSTQDAIVWGFVTNKLNVQCYWGIFLNTEIVSKGDVIGGIDAIDFGVINVNSVTSIIRQITGLEPSTTYQICAFLADQESGSETSLVKITISTKDAPKPDQTGGLPYTLPLTLGT